MAAQEWFVTKVITDPETRLVTLVAVNNSTTPTREVRLRVDASVVATRNI